MLLLNKNEALRLDLSGAPSAPWNYSISYKRRGQSEAGPKSAVGTIADGNPVTAIAAPDGFHFRQAEVDEITVTNLGNAALTLQVQKYDGSTVTVVQQYLVQVGQTFKYNPSTIENGEKIHELRADISAAQIVGLGANTSGILDVGTLPAGAIIQGVSVFNKGVAALTLASLTATVGTNVADHDNIKGAQSVFAADAGSAGPGLVTTPHLAAATLVRSVITGNANLSTLTGLTNGIAIVMKYTLPNA